MTAWSRSHMARLFDWLLESALVAGRSATPPRRWNRPRLLVSEQIHSFEMEEVGDQVRGKPLGALGPHVGHDSHREVTCRRNELPELRCDHDKLADRRQLMLRPEVEGAQLPGRFTMSFATGTPSMAEDPKRAGVAFVGSWGIGAGFRVVEEESAFKACL